VAGRGVGHFARYAGVCWRAVALGREAQALDGTIRAGRYNRPGDRTLYMSGSPAGVAAAMARYGEAERSIVRLNVVAERLVDLRDAAGCTALGIDPARIKEDWIAALDRGEEPASWVVADRARAIGAAGMIDASRRAPTEWHLVLFAWNDGSGTTVDRALDWPDAE